MRRSAVPVVALVAAVLGGIAALMLAKATGWADSGGTRTVVLPPADVSAAVSAHDVARVPARLASRDFNPARTYAQRSAGVVTVYASLGDDEPLLERGSQGSGFVVSPKGYILTNAHVITSAPGSEVEPAKRLYVEFEDGDRVQARIIGWDIFNDIGLIRVSPGAHRLRPVPLGDSDHVVVGEPVSAIGSPFGNQNTLTVGVVSGTRRSIASLASDYRIIDAIQTDASINHGNSGGPLFDADGRAIGINAQIRSTSGLNQGVGFAVPINTAKRAMAQLIATGRVAYAYVGVSTDDLTPTVARHLRYGTSYGAVIECVTSGSPGARAGLRGGQEKELFNGREVVRGGDVIVAIEGHPVRSNDDVARIVTERLHPGQVADFRIVRGSQTRTVQVKLGERPTRPANC